MINLLMDLLNLSNNKNINVSKDVIIHRNLNVAKLYQLALQEGCQLSSTGALVAFSGEKTGRSPNDKRIVDTDNNIWFDNNSPNTRINDKDYRINKNIALNYIFNQKNIYVFDGYAGWDPVHQIRIRTFVTCAYHALFLNNILIRPTSEELKTFQPEYYLYNAGGFYSNIECEDVSSSTLVQLNLQQKEIVILGTKYAGEMKKAIFTIMHYLMPQKNILSLHSSSNISKLTGETSIFFGLSGTGKTTLSSDPNRTLIGDDEHCWTNSGVFNIEGGCYAKCVNLNPKFEPDIFECVRFGCVIENVVLDNNNNPDFTNTSITQNTRACYSTSMINNIKLPCLAGHPTNVILLTCDAFGLLPIVSKLNNKQALYYFLSGYTAKIPGTEQDVMDPIATFSACFGEAFLALHPLKYAQLLEQKLNQHNAKCWLINTGWVGGKYGSKNGTRCKLSITRDIINKIHSGELLKTRYKKLEIFNLEYPSKLKKFDNNLLNPKDQWINKEEYDKNLKKLAKDFINNFNRYNIKSTEIIKAGPLL